MVLNIEMAGQGAGVEVRGPVRQPAVFIHGDKAVVPQETVDGVHSADVQVAVVAGHVDDGAVLQALVL